MARTLWSWHLYYTVVGHLFMCYSSSIAAAHSYAYTMLNILDTHMRAEFWLCDHNLFAFQHISSVGVLSVSLCRLSAHSRYPMRFECVRHAFIICM